ncbi:MAG: hypothetical protein ACR2P4_03795 [Gammaproteobacteria bacterium]
MKNRPAILAAFLLALFGANVSIGKYRLWSETGTAAPLDGVPEFLLLLSAVALFVVSAMAAETQRRQSQRISASENHGT